MEEKGFIEIKFEGVINGRKITPLDIDISEIKEIITDIESFLYPNRSEKKDRPRIAYSLEYGSVKHKFILPITGVLLFSSIISEINQRKSIDFLDFNRAEFIDKYQKKAKNNDYEITFSSSVNQDSELKFTQNSNYYNAAPNWIQTEFILYGEVYQEGGINPNLHILTKEFGKLTVSATKEQILEGEKRLYKVYGLRVRGKQNIDNKKPYDLKLVNFIDYNPIFDKLQLDLLIEKATPNLSKIANVDVWLNQIREGGLYE